MHASAILLIFNFPFLRQMLINTFIDLLAVKCVNVHTKISIIQRFYSPFIILLLHLMLISLDVRVLVIYLLLSVCFT